MRLAFTLKTALPVDQTPLPLLLMLLELHFPNHQPLYLAQLLVGQASLSLSGVLNFLPLARKRLVSTRFRALPASPLYPDTVSRYLPASPLMENVEYSADLHLPEVRWIYSQTHVGSDAVYLLSGLKFINFCGTIK